MTLCALTKDCCILLCMEEGNNLEIYTVDSKKYKSVFYICLITNIVCTGLSFLLAANGFRLLNHFYPDTRLTLSILFVMVVFAFLHSSFTRSRLRKLLLIEDFDERADAYEKLYRLRVFWFLFSGLVSCGLALLSGRTLFCYYAMFDIVISLNYYPNLALFKKELNNEEIIFY